MTIPLLDLQAQYRAIASEIHEAVRRVLESGQFILGPEGEALEQEIAAYCGAQHAIAVASGTDALELALRALGIGPGDEVITTSFSFFATAEAIVLVGATPVFVDIESDTYALDVAQLDAKRTPRTKAVLPVHLYGHPCDLTAVRAFADRHGLKVIEDGAQAIGAAIGGRRIGGLGDLGCLSFYPTKNLGGYGDGGMVLTNDGRLAECLRLLRAHGSRVRYAHTMIGRNSRLDELQAAILRVKLRHLEVWTDARRRHAARYREALAHAADRALVLPVERPGCRHVYHLYTIRTAQRERIADALAAEGIATQVAYPSTLPSQPPLAAYAKGAYPVAEQAAREVLALPLYPELTPEMVDAVAGVVLQAVHRS